MKKFLLIFLIIPAFAFGRKQAIDTTGFDGTYNVGDSIGGYEVAAVTSLDHADFQLRPGKNATHGGTDQTDWDVYILDSNITLTLDPDTLSEGLGALIAFTRNTTGSVAPRRVIIDLQDFTLTLNLDSLIDDAVPMISINTGGYGSTTGGVSDSIIIKNGTLIYNLNEVITKNAGEGTEGNRGQIGCIQMIGSVNNIDLINLDIKVNEAYSSNTNKWSIGGLGVDCWGSHPSATQWGNFEHYYDDVDVWNYSTAFFRRDRIWGSGMALGHNHRKDSMNSLFSITVDSNWSHYTVTNSVIHITPHFGWYGYGTWDFHDNICSTASRNDFYEYFDPAKGGDPKSALTSRATSTTTWTETDWADSGTAWPTQTTGRGYGLGGTNWNAFWTSSNSYALVLSDGLETSGRSAGPGTRIYNNTIARAAMSGSNTWQGNRGFSIEGCIGTSSDPIRIFNNTITVSQGPNGDFSTGTGWGIRIRWAPTYTYMYDNTINIIVDERPNDGTPADSIPSSAGYNMSGIRASFSNEAGGDSASNMKIYNNTITSTLHNDSVFGAADTAVQDVGFACENRFWNSASGHTGTDLEVYGNMYKVFTNGIRLGGTGTDGSCVNMTIRDDTVYRNTRYNAASWNAVVGGYGDSKPDTNNLFLDIVYQNGADEDDFSMSKDGNDYWHWGRKLKILAVGTGTPPNVGVATCSLIALSNYANDTIRNAVAFSPTTATITDTIIYQHVGSGIYVPDSLKAAFNNFVFKARDDAQVTPDSTITIDADRPDGLVLVFSGVAGSIDTTGWNGSPAAAASGPRAKFRK